MKNIERGIADLAGYCFPTLRYIVTTRWIGRQVKQKKYSAASGYCVEGNQRFSGTI